MPVLNLLTPITVFTHSVATNFAFFQIRWSQIFQLFDFTLKTISISELFFICKRTTKIAQQSNVVSVRGQSCLTASTSTQHHFTLPLKMSLSFDSLPSLFLFVLLSLFLLNSFSPSLKYTPTYTTKPTHSHKH